MCITHILQRYGPLTSYFKSANEKQPRFRRLAEAFSNPLMEVYLLFLQATLPVFSTLNLLLQREKASIFQLYEEMKKFIKKLCSRFMTPAALREGEVHDIPHMDPQHQLPGEKLNVGFTTRATLNRLLEAGDVTSQEAKEFQQAALAFLVRAVEYAMAKLPLTDPLLKHARFVNVQLRAECGVEDALYFVDRFQGLLPYHDPKEQDQISEEFMDYQLMDIAMPEDPTSFDVEEFWGKTSSTKNKAGAKTRQVAETLLGKGTLSGREGPTAREGFSSVLLLSLLGPPILTYQMMKPRGRPAGRPLIQGGPHHTFGPLQAPERLPCRLEYLGEDQGLLFLAGMNAKVKNFRQHCSRCQCTAPKKPAPLMPLPIISFPFERVGMDLVGPLLKLAWVHEHILLVVDYATHDSEAVPFPSP
ncbi:uncharacterized protein LOC132900201 [Neoarius graeffei]|uniref:uncharacterized protein LOC132900201 n=1 Tax=Neoarius graeffei TaxID=443677 RepID=UPI00298C24C8|nr:uncharacterized protein LOC132900201 [Neoarius graeffei]